MVEFIPTKPEHVKKGPVYVVKCENCWFTAELSDSTLGPVFYDDQLHIVVPDEAECIFEIKEN